MRGNRAKGCALDAKQGPFSLYDFLGYFFPGAIAIFAWSYCLSALGDWAPTFHPKSITKWSDLLPFVLAGYVLGHVFSLLSSLTIERYFIWSFGYPSKSLLRYKADPYLARLPDIAASNVARMCVWLLLAPISVLVTLLCATSNKKAGFVAQLDPLLARMIRRKITGLIVERGQITRPNDYIGPREGDFFRLAYHYVLEHAPAHGQKMQNYVALFGFNRSLCLIFVSLFWFSLLAWVFGSTPNAPEVALLALTFANVFFFGFAKFYRRFSLEALMALSVAFQISTDGGKGPLPARPPNRVRVGHDLREHPSQLSLLMRAVRARIRTRVLAKPALQ